MHVEIRLSTRYIMTGPCKTGAQIFATQNEKAIDDDRRSVWPPRRRWLFQLPPKFSESSYRPLQVQKRERERKIRGDGRGRERMTNIRRYERNEDGGSYHRQKPASITVRDPEFPRSDGPLSLSSQQSGTRKPSRRFCLMRQIRKWHTKWRSWVNTRRVYILTIELSCSRTHDRRNRRHEFDCDVLKSHFEIGIRCIPKCRRWIKRCCHRKLKLSA